jgi:hypothetical protein
MRLSVHPDITITYHRFGNEKAPLLVIDNVVRGADELTQYAARLRFSSNSAFYPGVRAEAPHEYQHFLLNNFAEEFQKFFELSSDKFSLSLCHYSLTTTPASELRLLQRIPHFDSLERSGLASVHYLFKRPLGGTAFYRHIKTDFESIDESRKIRYLASLESENGGPNIPKSGYINGDTPLYQQIMRVDGVYNRMIVYRRNSLHSGCIAEDFIPDLNVLMGRLSINAFIDPL